MPYSRMKLTWIRSTTLILSIMSLHVNFQTTSFAIIRRIKGTATVQGSILLIDAEFRVGDSCKLVSFALEKQKILAIDFQIKFT